VTLAIRSPPKERRYYHRCDQVVPRRVLGDTHGHVIGLIQAPRQARYRRINARPVGPGLKWRQSHDDISRLFSAAQRHCRSPQRPAALPDCPRTRQTRLGLRCGSPSIAADRSAAIRYACDALWPV